MLVLSDTTAASLGEGEIGQMCLIPSFKSLDTTKQEEGNTQQLKLESHPLRRIGKKTQSDLKFTHYFNAGLPNSDTFAWKFKLSLKTL